MQVTISTRHGHVSEATQGKIAAKVEKLARLFERLMSIEVTVDLEHKESPLIDLRVKAEHKHEFVAHEQAGDLMAAVDGALHKVEQQLRKYKDRVQGHQRSSATRLEGEAESLGEQA